MGPGLGPQPCSWGASGWAVGLGPGAWAFLQVLDDPTNVMVFPFAAKEQYFIPGGKVGESGAVRVGRCLWVGRSWGSSLRGWASLLGACPGPQPRPGHLTAGTEDYQLNSECNSDVVCPHKCRCEAGVAECSSLRLTKIPERIPQSTAEL